MQDLRVFVTNFLASGIGVITLEVDGYEVELEQVFNLSVKEINKFKGQKVPTTEILVKSVKPKDVKRVLKLCDRLCWLMSLAGLSMSARFKYEYPDGQPVEERNVIGSLNTFRPTLNLRDRAAIKTYLQNGYSQFKKYETSRDLRAVIGYLTTAHSHQIPLQFQLLGCFVVLESLKSTFADVKSIPFIAGGYRKGPNPTRKSKKYSFEDLLKMMLQEQSLRYGLRKIVKLRNDIVHTGYTKRTFNHQLDQFERVNDILRVYLLKLLSYQGTYPIYSSANRSYGEI